MSGSSTQSSSTTCARPAQRVERLASGRAATRSTVARSVTTSGSTIESRCSRCCGPHSTTIVSRSSANSPGFGSASVGDRRRRRRASCGRPSTAHDDRARRVVAADAAQAVGDLAADHCAVDDADEVQHARRARSPRSRAWNSTSSCAQRRLDRRRRRVLRRPDLVADGHARPQIARQSSPARAGSSRPPSGPWRAGLVLRQRPGRALERARRSGRRSRHCASTSSLRVKSVASPRIASMISRS